MVARGELLIPSCSLCGLESDSSYHGAPGRGMQFHCEDYTRPLQAVRICIECHLRLHARFHAPNRWLAHCLAIRSAPAQPWITVGHNRGEVRDKESCHRKECGRFFCATFGQRDLPPLDFTPDPARWWERLSFDPILKAEPPTGVRIELIYGASNDIDSLTIRVVRDNVIQFPIPNAVQEGFAF
jgi:hypothetical protein